MKILNLIKGFLLLMLCTGLTPARKHKSFVPPDFDMVQGNDKLPAFLISKNPVSNFEYLLYCEWNRKVFTDYPEIYQKALPAAADDSTLLPLNDPSINGYFGHPAYAAYPVTGVNWRQIQEYCSWKNDRLNEDIIFDLENYNFTSNYQRDAISENNFNTEAFINFQYAFSFVFGEKLKYVKKYETGDNRRVNDPSLYPYFLHGARLPSEEEWLHYKAVKNTNELPKYVPGSYRKLAGFVKISDAYYDAFAHQFCTGKIPESEHFYEWMLDTFTNEVTHFSSLENLFSGSGIYNLENVDAFNDQYGQLDAKDSLGRFGFRIMGWNKSGTAKTILRYGYRLMYANLINLENSRDSVCIDSLKNFIVLNKLDSALRYGRGRPVVIPAKGVFYTNLINYICDGVNLSIDCSNWLVSGKSLEKYLSENATYRKYVWGIRLGQDLRYTPLRIMRSQKLRRAISETNAPRNVGFRVVIPYYGNALPKEIDW